MPLGHGGSKSGRQESNLPCTAYQTVAWPLGHGPNVSALYGTRTRLACSTGRSPHPLRHRAQECPAGVAPACPPRQGGAWAARPRTPEARTEGVEPSPCALEAHCSPRSTSLTGGTGAWAKPRAAESCPGRTRTYNRRVNSAPHNRLCYGTVSCQPVLAEGVEPPTPRLRGDGSAC